MGLPVATPIKLADLRTGLKAFFHPNNEVDEFRSAVQAFLGDFNVNLVNSGRSALYVTLEALKGTSHCREVVIPAFVCPSVAKAVEKAGLKVVPCDVTRAGFGLDPESLKQVLSDETLAVVATHLFGYPSDLSVVQRLANGLGVKVIEDAAQAFGATVRSRPVGTLADIGIFSFGISKVLCTMGGGVILTKDEQLAHAISIFLDKLHEPSLPRQIFTFTQLAALTLLTRSQHLGLLMQIWESMRSDDLRDFEIMGYPPFQAAIGRNLLRRFAEISADRARVSRHISEGLAGIKGILLPRTNGCSEPVFLRFPIVVHDLTTRARLLKRLRSAGINVSKMYDRKSFDAICGLAARLIAYPNTQYLADRMIVLPTHSFMREGELKATLNIFHEIFG